MTLYILGFSQDKFYEPDRFCPEVGQGKRRGGGPNNIYTYK
jgi:hypothetical protein